MKFLVSSHDIGGHISLMGEGKEVFIDGKSNGTHYPRLALIACAVMDHYKNGSYAKPEDFATHNEVIECLFSNSDNWRILNPDF